MHIDWANFTPWGALVGGALIGLAASLLLLANGRIAGISGIFGGLLRWVDGDIAWRAAFIFGLLLAPLFWSIFAPGGLVLPRFTANDPAGWLIIGFSGLLVGFGTRLANGCTSGHGVCGLAQLSPRSLVAVGVFMTFGFMSVYLIRHVIWD
jgi:uncharacterized membrane protein YedE/YeeE